MKRLIAYFLFATALFAAWACGKGEQEVAPAEKPKEEVGIIKDTVKQDSPPPMTEIPCEKDSTPIALEKVDIAMGIIGELTPKDTSKPYSYPRVNQPFYIIINSTEHELYGKLVTQQGEPIPAVDFEKNSLVVAGFTATSSDGLKDLRVRKECKEGRLRAEVLLFAGAGAAFTPVNFSFTIPKLKEGTQIQFNISY
ncbi:hypothetical protein [Thermoflexibacter ruber]|uniref:Lipoprotein n=1 Tax=Thermoflexibacter ruber TaxID=1003 RepID=A0A1I2KCB8_9BACT|nr:hypothetical protein [Thermoflexibacter ruber]SFF63773.1 hypothetical protein SAMN04488541_11002 [Thermoflexibacter ruber]SFF63860.1 hypothetical protein SAMN04488541_11011 [Thermoflexibacter ruber]